MDQLSPHLLAPARAVDRRFVSIACGVILTALGLYVISGWLLGIEMMVRILTESVAMRLNTAICFIVTGGLFFSMSVAPSREQRLIVRVLAGLLTLAAASFLLQRMLDVDFGINFNQLHPSFFHDNPKLGLISANSSVAFILTGLAFLIASEARHSRRTLTLTRCLALLVMIIALSSLAITLLNLNFIYEFTLWNQMATPTVFGFIVTGAGLWLLAPRIVNAASIQPLTHESRITYTAVLIMAVLTLGSGLSAFVVLKQYADETLQDKLQREAQAIASHFVDSIEQQLNLASGMAALPGLGAELALVEHADDNQGAALALSLSAQRFMAMGFDRIAFYDPQGSLVKAYGIPDLAGEASATSPLYELPLDNTGHNDIMQWRDGFFLKSTLPILDQDKAVGSVVIEQDMQNLTQAFHDIQNTSRTSDAALCGRGAGDMVRCFPTRFAKVPNPNIPMYKNGKPSFPIVYGILGERRVMFANNPQGIPILAATTPIGSTGLGLVVRIETAELYAVVKERFGLLLGCMVLLVAAGAALLRYQVHPLAARLAASEKIARIVNEQLSIDGERLSQVIQTQDMIASASFDLEQIMQKSVDQLARLTGADFTVIEMLQGDELYYHAVGGTVAAEKGIRIKLTNSLSGVCIRERAIINCPDTEADRRVDHVATRRANIHSMMVAPLIHEGEVLGVLKIASHKSGFFGDAEGNTLKLLSGLIGSAVGKQLDYDAKQKLLVERTHMAQHDMLTGLPNRALFLDRLSTAILRADRSDKAMALLFLDLDGFKQVNDTKGHRAGDEVLREFAHRLEAVVRKTDVVARLAGDEFMIILEGLTDPVDNVNTLAKKLLGTTQTLFRLPSGDVFLGVSIGAVINHKAATNVDELIHKADEEMYKAKKAGKNRCCILGQTA